MNEYSFLQKFSFTVTLFLVIMKFRTRFYYCTGRTFLYLEWNLKNLIVNFQVFYAFTYSVTHMDSYRSKLVFWALFIGLETCPSRFVMGSTVHFIFWNNVQTKWIFEFWPYFQKIPMWKHKKLENWRSNFPNFIPDIKMYTLCNNKNLFENSL